ncbi:MAG: UDP-N-acetylmuramate--L-alanine ligase [Spirochaetia bacterium]|nr:UDP-N-acetylmuramate--L-alanine ligase [Spirochaetia bacterium]
MADFMFPAKLAGLRVHLVGAKGTGMCALAEFLSARGALLSGSDVQDSFYTDTMLAALGVRVTEFSATAITPDLDLVVHSLAYQPDSHPELVRAREIGLPIATYPEALGALSRLQDSSGICGVHGKTTTTAMAGALAAASGLSVTTIAGSAVSSFGGHSILSSGDRHLIAETCEYRRSFLNFSPARVLLTSVEPDHQDYYPDYEAIRTAFIEYLSRLPHGAPIIYCADDAGAVDTVRMVSRSRPDLRPVPYGFSASGPFRLSAFQVRGERSWFNLDADPGVFSLRVPGRHLALDAAGALALCASIIEDEGRVPGPDFYQSARLALSEFRGSKRRAEILGEAGGILFMDDYAHHPSAIRLTLKGLREFYPNRRLVVDFMSHTYSRTKALFDDFASAFSDAHLVIAHRIYASAREEPDPTVSGELLADAMSRAGTDVVYLDSHEDAADRVTGLLKPGDLFLTMGAGDNWKLGAELFKRLSNAKDARP